MAAILGMGVRIADIDFLLGSRQLPIVNTNAEPFCLVRYHVTERIFFSHLLFHEFI